MPWQSWRSRAARLQKRVRVVDRSPRKAWGPWGPRGARQTLHTKPDAGVSWLPFLPFQAVHPGATRPSGEANLSLVPRPSVWPRGSSEAGLTLGSFLGGGQHSAIGAKDCTRLTLLALGSWEALLAFGAQVSLRPGWSGKASEPGAALGSWHAGHCSVLLRHVDDRPWGSRGSREAWLPHSVLPWVAFLSLGPFFSFWPLGSSRALSAGEAGEPGTSICSDFSLSARWPSWSRIPLDSRQAGRSLWPVSTSRCRPEGSPGAFHVIKPCGESWSRGPREPGGPWRPRRPSWSGGSCQAVLARSANGAGVSLASLRSWGAGFTEAAFLAGPSWPPVSSWRPWGSRGSGEPGRPLAPRHAGEACRSWDV